MSAEPESIRVNADDGSQYQLWHWSCVGDTRALVLILHGAAEHGGRYQVFAEQLIERGFAVVAVDHYGHGLSDGPRVSVQSLAQLTEGLRQMKRWAGQQYSSVPWVLFGHSLGGLLAVNELIDSESEYRAAAVSGAAIQSDKEPGALLKWVVGQLARWFPTLGLIKLEADGVSRLPEEVERYCADPLVYNGALTAGLLKAMFSAMDRVKRRASELHLPMLVMHGEQDPMTAPQGSQWLYDTISSREKSLLLLPEAYHEILNEPEQDQVYQALFAFLDEHCPAG